MFCRNLIVVFKPVKNNFVLLSEANHQLLRLSDNGNNCLHLECNRNICHYMAWASYGGQSVRDTEIGINALVAQEIGLVEGTIVTCKLMTNVAVLSNVHVSAANKKDWEMLDVSSYRIQNTLLDQTQIVNRGQKLIVWINRAMHITLNIDKLNPDLKYGKIVNDTEVIVTPFKENLQHSRSVCSMNGIKIMGTDDISKKHVNTLPSEKPPSTVKTFTPKNKNEFKTPVNNSQMNGNGYNALRNSFSTSSVHSLSESECKASDLITSKRNSLLFQEPTPSMHSPLIVKTSDYPLLNSGSRIAQCKQLPKKRELKEEQRKLNQLMDELRKEYKKPYRFRIIPTKWEDSQMVDLFTTRHNLPGSLDINQVYTIRIEQPPANDPVAPTDYEVLSTKEICVNIKLVSENTTFPKNNYPTIEMNDVLMAHLNLKPLDHIILRPKQTVLNLIERIELHPAEQIDGYRGIRTIEEAFKQMIIDNTRLFPMLINQQQLFRLVDGQFTVTVKIFPETFRYGFCDADVLRDCKITCVEEIRDVTALLKMAEKINDFSRNDELTESKSFVNIDKSQIIVDECVNQIIYGLCLDERNCIKRWLNFIIEGGPNTGKSKIVNEILNNVKAAPYYCYTSVYYCARSKGRKPDKIQRHLRFMFSKCIEYSPSIIVLDNLDSLAQKVVEQTQDAEYYNTVSDIIAQFIMEYSRDRAIVVIATVSNKNNLNERIYTPRGRHLFQAIHVVGNLEMMDRKKVIEKLCERVNTRLGRLNYEEMARLTEGYTIADLVQLIERAVFYAYKENSKTPTLTHNILMSSLKTTNDYCLRGIENHHSANGTEEVESIFSDKKFPGMESAVTVLEEVLKWPSMYPKVFENSPLRNQAGVLLFGAPGTGKTLLVRELARLWNLRMISVKGPELLAKFIGQSEENVRKLFEKARNAKPCVLFFDEFDSLAPRRGHDSTGVTDRVVNQLLTELDGVEGLQGVVVIAATSRPELLDPALLRSGRIDRMVECTLPNQEARSKIFRTLADAASLHFDDTVHIEYFMDSKSEYYTGADIQSILTSANMIAVKECIARNGENLPEQIYITQTHLKEAFESTRPSLSLQDVQRYTQMFAKFLNKEKSARDFVAQKATLA